MNARSALECGSPLPLSNPHGHHARSQSARGLAQSKTWRGFGASLVILCLAVSASAQTYSIDWYKVSGGGGAGTGGVYSVSGTIGQPDASGAMSGAMSGEPYSVTGGFWALYAVQTPGAPYLWVMRTTTNTICVWWAVSATNWQLQATTALVRTGSVWTACSYTTNGANCVYIQSAPTGKRFYRLWNP
jgi:hypothetical protein